MRGMLLRMSMRAYGARYWRTARPSSIAPDVAQRAVLARLMADNSDTRFGIEHGFADIRDPAQFRTRVPVHEYEQLRPYIDRQRHTGSTELTKEAPLFYA